MITTSLSMRRVVTTSVLATVILALTGFVSIRPVHAGAGTTWSSPSQIAGNLVDAAAPAIAYTSDGLAHALWQADGQIFYSYQLPSQGWSPAQRIASGSSPTLSIDAQGRLHALFANSFQGNYEIYHIKLTASHQWTLPSAVSHTSGPSVQPVLVADARGYLHAAWMDFMSDEWLIYIGTWNGTSWSSYAVNNAAGKDPALAVLADGTVALAWQYALLALNGQPGAYDIFASERVAGNWSLPVDLSYRAEGVTIDSTGASMLAGQDNRMHVTWQEGAQDIQYAFGRGMYWPSPVTVGHGAVVARGPQISVGDNGRLYIAWDEGEDIGVAEGTIGATNWPPATVLSAPLGDQKDVTLTAISGGVMLGWVQTDGAGISTVFERRLLSPPTDYGYKSYLPLTLR